MANLLARLHFAERYTTMRYSSMAKYNQLLILDAAKLRRSLAKCPRRQHAATNGT
jgi:hypothetical protein